MTTQKKTSNTLETIILTTVQITIALFLVTVAAPAQKLIIYLFLVGCIASPLITQRNILFLVATLCTGALVYLLLHLKTPEQLSSINSPIFYIIFTICSTTFFLTTIIYNVIFNTKPTETLTFRSIIGLAIISIFFSLTSNLFNKFFGFSIQSYQFIFYYSILVLSSLIIAIPFLLKRKKTTLGVMTIVIGVLCFASTSYLSCQYCFDTTPQTKTLSHTKTFNNLFGQRALTVG